MLKQVAGDEQVTDSLLERASLRDQLSQLQRRVEASIQPAGRPRRRRSISSGDGNIRLLQAEPLQPRPVLNTHLWHPEQPSNLITLPMLDSPADRL